MKTAEFLLKYMDELQRVIEIINSYVDRGLDFLQRAKEWVLKAIAYIEQAIDSLVDTIGGRPSTIPLMFDDYMFV